MSLKWLVIADGAKAQFYRYQGRFRTLDAIPEGNLTHVNKSTKELTTARQGRVFNSADGARSAMEHTTDPHEHEKLLFAKEVADFLKQHSSQFSRLVVVAAPKFLGYLRKVVPDPIKAKVELEIGKDLTNTPQQQLPEMMKSICSEYALLS